MHTLFQHGPEGRPPGHGDEPPPAPSLLVELPWWPRVFFGNLRDLLAAPFRREPPLELSSRPADFWPDVFVNRRMPVAPLRQSALYHLFVLVALWGFSHTWLARPSVQPRSPFENAKVAYYPVSEYLPALVDETDPAPARVEAKGDPVPARQRIRSVPRRPDNQRQTIVTPSPLTIHSDVPLPNIIAWDQPEAPAPVAAAASLRTRMPEPLQAAPIAPPPLPTRTQMASALPQPVFIAPPKPIQVATSKPKLELPAPALPATSLRGRPLEELGIPHSAPADVVLRSPVVERSAVPIRAAGRRQANPEAGAAAPPALAASGTKESDVRQLVALGVHPVMPAGPLRPPDGNRRGTFAAGPEGRPGASGAPDIQGNRQSGSGGTNDGSTRTPLPGLTVEKPPVEMATINPPSAASVRGVFAQALARARVPDIPRPRATPPAASEPTEPRLEDYGAGPKKYYSMFLNMPNLTSSRGSWIIRFAELSETQDRSPVSAPVVTVKVDPAYPTELLRNGVEGVVLLYAVIRADGSVSAVRVLQGLDSRLDSSACAALRKWHFRPGTKNGNAIDLEAVVQIPFQVRSVY